jgi:hypothetical protein
MKPVFQFLFIFAITSASYAESFRVGHPNMAGDGCPVGTAQAAVLEDGSTVSILFDNFITTAKKGYFPPVQTARRCHFKIPIDIPAGYSLVPLKITYSGFALLTRKNTATISTSGPLLTMAFKDFKRPPIVTELKTDTANFQVSQVINVNKLAPCSSFQFVEFSTEITLNGGGLPFKGPGYFLEEAMITIDAADMGDVHNPIQIQFQLNKC